MKWFRRFRPTAVLLLTLLPGLAATFGVGLYIARARWIGWLNGEGPVVLDGNNWRRDRMVGPFHHARGLAAPAEATDQPTGKLQEELDDLSALAKHLTPTAGQDPALDAAARSIELHLEHVRSSLGDSGECGRAWVDGTGYVDLWRHLHRAEEALLMLRPAAALIGTAVMTASGSWAPRSPSGTACAPSSCAP